MDKPAGRATITCPPAAGSFRSLTLYAACMPIPTRPLWASNLACKPDDDQQKVDQGAYGTGPSHRRSSVSLNARAKAQGHAYTVEPLLRIANDARADLDLEVSWWVDHESSPESGPPPQENPPAERLASCHHRAKLTIEVASRRQPFPPVDAQAPDLRRVSPPVAPECYIVVGS